MVQVEKLNCETNPLRFALLVMDIQALGYDEQTAVRYATLIGEFPIRDLNGNIVVIEEGREWARRGDIVFTEQGRELARLALKSPVHECGESAGVPSIPSWIPKHRLPFVTMRTIHETTFVYLSDRGEWIVHDNEEAWIVWNEFPGAAVQLYSRPFDAE